MRATCPTHSTLPDVITLIIIQLYQHEVRISIPWKLLKSSLILPRTSC